MMHECDRSGRHQGREAAEREGRSGRQDSSLRGLGRPRRAFTLVELLVVVVILGVLLTVLLMVSGRVLHSQKAAATRSLMSQVRTAIDQFAAENPLQHLYDRPDLRSFGPYPPYQLANAAAVPAGGSPLSVAQALEPQHRLLSAGAAPAVPVSLAQRLALDFSGTRAPDVGAYVSASLQSQSAQQQRDNDIRALYAYLRAYSPGTLNQIPESAKRPLVRGPAEQGEFINPTGAGTAPGASGLVEVLGIFDAWGVPLDYFLYIKLEYRVEADGMQRWVVTDRVPVLRSLGVSKDEWEANAPAASDPQNWIFSEPLPQPVLECDRDQGTLIPAPALDRRIGWARARASGTATDPLTWDTYGYVPEH